MINVLNSGKASWGSRSVYKMVPERLRLDDFTEFRAFSASKENELFCKT